MGSIMQYDIYNKELENILICYTFSSFYHFAKNDIHHMDNNR